MSRVWARNWVLGPLAGGQVPTYGPGAGNATSRGEHDGQLDQQHSRVRPGSRRAGDEGQTAVEYLGIIAVVVAIVLAITGTDIGQTIYNAITDKISEVTGG